MDDFWHSCLRVLAVLHCLSLYLFANAEWQHDPALCINGSLEDTSFGEEALLKKAGADRFSTPGIKYASAGDLKNAMLYFRAAGVFETHLPATWNNFALAQRDMAKKRMAGLDQQTLPEVASKASKLAKREFREVLSALSLADVLGQDDAEGVTQHVLHIFQEYFPEVCSKSRGDKSACLAVYPDEELAAFARDAAKGLLKNEDRVERAKKLCRKQEQLEVPISKKERHWGTLNPSTVWKAYWLLEACGVIVLQHALPIPFVASMLDEQKRHFAPKRDTVNKHDSYKVQTQDMAYRSKMRFEMRLDPEVPFTCPSLLSSRYVFPIMKTCLGNAIEIEEFSYVIAMAGAPEMHWHRDTNANIFNNFRSKTTHLPPHGLVATIPLINVTDQHGPTGFMMASHVDMPGKFWATDDDENLATPVLMPTSKAGDVIIFDLRLQHFAGANPSRDDRPVLYINFARDWYRDTVNFKEQQSAAWGQLWSNRSRKLLARVDSRAYQSQLANAAGPDHGKSSSTCSRLGHCGAASTEDYEVQHLKV